MINLEEQLNKQDTGNIRRYLLHWLDEKTTEEIDEKILTEPGFWDCVLLIEEELLEDFAAGKLNNEEKARVKEIYQSPADLKKVNFAESLYRAAEDYHRNEQSAALRENPLPLSSNPLPEKSFLGWFNWKYLKPLTVSLILITGISFLIWYILPNNKAVIEKELASLNQDTAKHINNKKLQTIDLEPDLARSVVMESKMPTIPISGNEELIRFQMSLVNNVSESYKATFLDEDGAELFSVSGIKSAKNQNGIPFVSVLVPLGFLHPGDFQINLQGQSNSNVSTKSGSFTFRIIQP